VRFYQQLLNSHASKAISESEAVTDLSVSSL
jgi:hypothetical protein